jgi:hypothetical protein
MDALFYHLLLRSKAAAAADGCWPCAELLLLQATDGVEHVLLVFVLWCKLYVILS